MTLRERFEKLEPRERRLLTILGSILGVLLFLAAPIGIITMVSHKRSDNQDIRDRIDQIYESRNAIADRKAKKDAISVAIKRLTFRKACPVRLEFYATCKPEATDLALSDKDLKSIGFLFDLQVGDQSGDTGQRVMPHLRYLNAKGGELQQKWQFKRRAPEVADIGGRNETVSHFHLADEGWEDLAGGQQKMAYNEIATKVNWHYFRFDFDLETMTALRFQCNDRVFDLGGFDSIRFPAMKNLWCMLNTCLFVETATDKRAFLYVDSVCLSGDF